jgi:hypothetical protein
MCSSVLAVFGVLLACTSLATPVSGSKPVAASKSSDAEASRAQVSSTCSYFVRNFIDCLSTAAPGSCSCEPDLFTVYHKCTTSDDNALVEVNVALQDLENTRVRDQHTFSCNCQLGPCACTSALLALLAQSS